MIKSHISLVTIITVASLFGIFAQSLSYFVQEHIFAAHPFYYLIAFTCSSVVLYIVAIITAYVLHKWHYFKRQHFEDYFWIIVSLGIPISMWSLFVLAMWWG